jgi:hypothetical protein
MEIHVAPHGNRWAVRDSLDGMPLSEYPTREEAELAGRQIAEERGAELTIAKDATTDESTAATEGAAGTSDPRPATEEGAADPADRTISRQPGF